MNTILQNTNLDVIDFGLLQAVACQCLEEQTVSKLSVGLLEELVELKAELTLQLEEELNLSVSSKIKECILLVDSTIISMSVALRDTRFIAKSVFFVTKQITLLFSHTSIMSIKSLDELHDIAFIYNRIVSSLSGVIYVRIFDDSRYISKAYGRIRAYGCIRSLRHKSH